MEILNWPAQKKRYLEKYRIEERFATKDLQFQLLHFDKGEYLTAPYKPLHEILFLVQGSVQIYHLRSDSEISPVAPAYPGAILGDMEFATGHPTAFYTEATEQVLCIGISLALYEESLKQDTVFLFEIMRSLGKKLENFSLLETASQSLKEQVLYYLEHFCPQGCMHSVNQAVLHLHCSRRQLQRVLKRLCEERRIEKQGKGTYRLLAREFSEL